MLNESKHFFYDGISSIDKGVSLISLSGLYEQPFMANRSIVETKVNGKIKPYFKHLDREPLEFEMTIKIDDWKNKDNVREIARWLCQDYYKPLRVEGSHEKIYQALIIGETTLNHNGLKEGYLTFTVRTNSPYSTSDLFTYELESENVILNVGDVSVNPAFRITNAYTDVNDFTITNLTTGHSFAITNIQRQEIVYIDFERDQIISSLEEFGVYRHNDFVGDEFELILDSFNNVGNQIIVEATQSDFHAEIEYRCNYLF